MNTDNGGPAFPCERERGERLESAPGMTLRDYFAAKAMQAMLSNFDWMRHTAESLPGIKGEEAVPMMAYEIADAMLKERAK